MKARKLAHILSTSFVHQSAMKKNIASITLFHTILFYYSSVGSRQRGVVPCARALQRRVPAGYIRERRHAQGVPHRGTHEVQERLQIQGM